MANPEQKEFKKINVSRFREADYQRTVWQATAEQGMVPDDLLEPSRWSLVSPQMQPFHRVEVVADDGSWWAEYLVTDATKLWAKLRILQVVQLDEAAKSSSRQKDGFSVKYRGAKKWSVIRDSDKSVMKDMLDTREDAEAAAETLLNDMAA